MFEHLGDSLAREPGAPRPYVAPALPKTPELGEIPVTDVEKMLPTSHLYSRDPTPEAVVASASIGADGGVAMDTLTSAVSKVPLTAKGALIAGLFKLLGGPKLVKDVFGPSMKTLQKFGKQFVQNVVKTFVPGFILSFFGQGGGHGHSEKPKAAAHADHGHGGGHGGGHAAHN